MPTLDDHTRSAATTSRRRARPTTSMTEPVDPTRPFEASTAPSTSSMLAPSGRHVGLVDSARLCEAILAELPEASSPHLLELDARSEEDEAPWSASAAAAARAAEAAAATRDESSAPEEDEDLLQAAARRLDWPTVCDAIADFCATEQAATLARRHPLLEDADLAVRRMCEVNEIATLTREGDRPPLEAIPDVRGAVLIARRGGVLRSRTLMLVGRAVATSNAVRRFFQTRREDAPLCWQQAEPMVPLTELERALEGVFEPDGELRDDASPELGALRQRVRRLHESLRRDIERRVHERDVEPHLQDAYYTMREGRYVLPVRVQARGRIEGIVHATSSSGQTVFVEPSDFVELNNRLRMADFDVRDEEERILRRLSEAVARHGEGLGDNLRKLFYFDLLRAGADLAMALDATVPEVVERGVRLRQARHPILVLRQREAALEAAAEDGPPPEDGVVPNDIVLEPEARILVVSGANAGGKTVTLKTLGLCALLLRAGLPVPAAPASSMPLFGTIFTDIGDEQSIARDTSTFSAHVLNLKRFLPHIDAQSLVLLDEPFSGTDPAHAAALAIALLEHLEGAGASAVVTTHLDRVKAYALDQSWLANASVDFDVDRMRPTYRLHLGIPGGSSALRIARRLGLDEALVERASELRSADPTGDLEQVIARLERARQALEEQQAAAARAEREAAHEAERLRQQTEKVRNHEVRVLGEEAAKLQRALHAAREQVSRIESELKEEAQAQRRSRRSRHEAARKARDELRQAEQAARDADRLVRESREPQRARVSLESLAVGDEVYSRSYQNRGRVVAFEKRGVTLQIGAFQVTVGADDLYAVQHQPVQGGRRALGGVPAAPVVVSASSAARGGEGGGGGVSINGESVVRATVPQVPENTCDLRGLRSDEAVERVELFLDSVLRRDLPNAFLIHGHGTGVLKRAVREHLQHSRYVTAQRPGDRHEGGDGVTVVYLR